ncbi:MAG: HAMP domain-containing histidine kinase [Chitinophagales bacterium]|nr:HAMP domain-containing histidine kinase [Chitinophagales bacterium]
MTVRFEYRKLIQYTLVFCTILIQIIILIFFYNEYFNENKLSEITQQIEKIHKISTLTNESRVELLHAHHYLNEYLTQGKKSSLDDYFGSLKNVISKMDSTKIYEHTLSSAYLPLDSPNRQDELIYLEKLIDSVYKFSPQLKIDKNLIQIKDFHIDEIYPQVDTDEKYIGDSLPKKNFFSRLKDAFKGNTNVKTDTVYITTTYNNTMDTSKIKSEIDSTMTEVKEHYTQELIKYQNKVKSIQSNSQKVYDVYNHLILLSNDLIDVYNLTSNDLSNKLEQQYNEQYSTINKIRRYTVFGLMVLLFIVLIIMAYFTKLSFIYESQLKEANDMVQKNLKFKNRILGMLSHEIRSPLKIVNLFLNKIQKNTTNIKIIDSLKSIRFTNDSLLIQTRQILDYTKNQEKQITLHPTQFNLRDEIVAILGIFKPYIESVDNQLLVRNDIPTETIVLADKGKIHQIFINLLGNANKFTQNGNIAINLFTDKLNDSEIRFSVNISDTGIGIPENDLQKIFAPYYRGVLSEDVENLGAGLGLNLCKEIIELLAGNISIKSTLGKGTSIDFDIKLATA